MAAQGPAGGRCGGRAREEGQPEAPAAGRGAIGGLLQGPGGHTPLALRLTQLGALGWGHGNRATTSTLHTGRRGGDGLVLHTNRICQIYQPSTKRSFKQRISN